MVTDLFILEGVGLPCLVLILPCFKELLGLVDGDLLMFDLVHDAHQVALTATPEAVICPNGDGGARGSRDGRGTRRGGHHGVFTLHFIIYEGGKSQV